MKIKDSCRNRRGCFITILTQDKEIKPVNFKFIQNSRVLKPKIKK